MLHLLRNMVHFTEKDLKIYEEKILKQPQPLPDKMTKDTVMTVVAAEDCTATHMSIPVSTPVKRFEVMAPRMCLRPGPAIFWRASLITFIPYIRTAMQPRSFRNVQIMLQI